MGGLALTPPLRIIVAVTEDPGHAFPALGLARELQARGHDVLVDTSERWRDAVEEIGSRFTPAPEYPPGGDGAFPSVPEAARFRVERIREFRPHVVVSDVFAYAPALAAEAAGARRATLISLVYVSSAPGFPPYALGLLPPRTRLGTLTWRAAGPALERALPETSWPRRLLPLLNSDRAMLGLAPFDRADRIVSDRLTLVATLPQLESPRRWPPGVHVTGPLFFDWPSSEVRIPDGDDPLVFVASSSVWDPELRFVEAALEAFAQLPVRVVATTSGRGERWDGALPANASVVDWVPYSQAVAMASLVVTQGGHGAVTRALAKGVPVLVCPAGGEMAENGARVTRSGAGLMVPRPLVAPAPMRWTARRLLADARFRERAEQIAAWARANDGARRSAVLVERYGGAND